MVDNRSAGHFGIGGAFNFRSGSISGTAANLSDDKMGQGNEYSSQRKSEEKEEHGHQDSRFMDRSAQLRATLNSLAMLNVASVLNTRKQLQAKDEEKEEFDERQFFKKMRKKKLKLLENEYLKDPDKEDEAAL